MSAFQSNFVASVIYNNRPLREVTKEGRRTCILPYGAEYKLRLKNKKSIRCQVELFIDGTDILFGKRLILNPGNSMDLERFVEDHNKGKKFKFVSINEAIDKGEIQDPEYPDNGKIEIKVYEEVLYTLTTNTAQWTTYPYPQYYFNNTANNSNIKYLKSTDINCCGAASFTGCNTASYCSSSDNTYSMNNDTTIKKGVTIEGEISDQKFYSGDNFAVTCFPETISIWLEGPIKENKSEKSSKFIYDTYIHPGLSIDATEQQKNESLKWMPLYIEAMKKGI